MKRIKLLLLGLLVAGPVFGWVAVADAQSFRAGTNASVPVGQTVDSTLFVTGQTVDIAGTVRGDVICAGNSVTITGTVLGDVICAGQTVQVRGEVEGDVRVAGQTVTLGGTVKQNLTAAGQTITFEGKSRVLGDASFGGQIMNLNGSIGRDLAVTGNTVTINGPVGRNMQGNLQDLTLGNAAKVGGNIAYSAPHDLVKSSDTQVIGEITRTEPESNDGQDFGAFLRGMGLYLFLSLMFLALILVLIMPQTFHRATDVALQNMGKTFLVGFLASGMVPVVLVMLLFTFIGIPLSVLGWLAWMVAVGLSGPFAAYLTGRLLFRGVKNAVAIMALGASFLLLLYLLPVVGFLIMLLALWFGLGIILINLQSFPKPQYNVRNSTHTAKTSKN